MPAWLLSFLISLAIKLGMPFLLKLFPNLPPGIAAIIQKLIEDLSAHSATKTALVAQAKTDIKQACSGVGCPTDLK